MKRATRSLAHTERAKRAGRSANRRRPKRAPLVLIAEDHDDTRRMYAEYLKTHGLRVLTAADGIAAIDAAVHARPDVVVMDLSLPSLDGWEATRRLKAHPETRRIPVIACTAHVLGGAVERALLVGCDAYVTKPCPPDVLLGEIRNMLDRPAPRKCVRCGGPILDADHVHFMHGDWFHDQCSGTADRAR